jgi:O-antigen/teichoic acid export membrane protein
MEQSRTGKAFLVAIGRFSNIIIAIALAAVLSRIIRDKEVYGAFQQILLLYSLFTMIFQAGLPQSVFYFLPKYGGDERKAFILQNLGLLFIQGTLMGLILYFLRFWLGRIMKSPHLPELLQVFALYPVFMLPTLCLEGILMIYGQVRNFMLFSILTRTLTFASLVLPLLTGFGLQEAMYFWVASAVIALLLALKMALTPVWRQKFNWHLQMLLAEVRYSLPLAAATVASCIICFSDRLAVSNLLGVADYALYSNGAVEPPLVAILVGSIQTVLMAEFSLKVKSGQQTQILEIWHRSVFKTAMLLLPFWGFLFPWAREVVVFLFSPRYEASTQVFSVYVWLVPAKLVAFTTILIPSGASAAVMQVNLAGALAAVVLIPLLTMFLGMQGAALGCVLVYWIIFGYGTIKAARIMNTRVRDFCPWGQIAILMAATFLIGLFSKAVGGLWDFDHYFAVKAMGLLCQLTLGGLIFSLAYLVFLEVMQYFSVINYGLGLWSRVRLSV